MKKKWAALFSQTGSEIYNIARDLKRCPDVIITNKPVHELEKINSPLLEEYWNKIVFLRKKPTVEEYDYILSDVNIVTLHGYLRIIPSEICEKYNIFNLHPAPLTRYPELKGKDPQKRIFEEKYEYGGNTIHKCTSVLDSGEICLEEEFLVKNYNFDIIIALTHKRAGKLWCKFLKNLI